jgi:trehalose 6-phosphate phosphatase
VTRLADLVPVDRPVALFLDYDGTLVGIRRRPELARLRSDRRAVLVRLARLAEVIIVSGRPLEEVRRLVGIPGLVYVGNHGLEIAGDGRVWVHPLAARRVSAVTRATVALRARTLGMPGILVEDKGLTASVHYRAAKRRLHKPILAIAEDEIRRSRGALVLRQGKMVLEIRPRLDWDKGQSVLRLLRAPRRRSRGAWPIYIGDDLTDEDAFRALGDRGLTVHVGRRADTLARNSLDGVGQVWTFLSGLVRRLSR